MENIFGPDYRGDSRDAALVLRARAGDKEALGRLVKKHQRWIYNIALRMAGNPEDAADVTQEALVKIITRLDTFRMKSSFRTWTYRIVVNHVLSMRRRAWEKFFFSFERQGDLIERLQDPGPPSGARSSAEEDLLLEETKTGCLTGMLLCLGRRERIALILSAFFGVDSLLGGELLETSAENYRQISSRAHRRLSNFMNERCGLINEENPCRCARTALAAARVGLVKPKKPRFNQPRIRAIREIVRDKTRLVQSALDLKVRNELRRQPMYSPPDFKRFLDALLKRRDVRGIVDYEDPSGEKGTTDDTDEN